MRKAITLVQFHGEKHLRVLTDSSTPIEDQKKAFKELQRSSREHPEYARIELWTSSNCAKSHKFRQPVEKKSPQEPAPVKEPAAPEPEPEKPAENANTGAGDQTSKTPKGTAKKSPKS